MTTFLQDTTGDLVLTNGKFSLVYGAQAGAQKIRNQFNLFLGEWFLNLKVGIPYYAAVFVKNPDLSLMTQLFRGILLQTPGVKSVENVQVTFDRANRAANVAFSCTWNDGSTITAAALDQPFVVTIPESF